MNATRLADASGRTGGNKNYQVLKKQSSRRDNARIFDATRRDPGIPERGGYRWGRHEGIIPGSANGEEPFSPGSLRTAEFGLAS